MFLTFYAYFSYVYFRYKKSCMTYLFDGHNDLEENQFQVKQKMFKL